MSSATEMVTGQDDISAHSVDKPGLEKMMAYERGNGRATDPSAFAKVLHKKTERSPS